LQLEFVFGVAEELERSQDCSLIAQGLPDFIWIKKLIRGERKREGEEGEGEE
jgi:hypothetical protein